jgi:hypothetical protein
MDPRISGYDWEVARLTIIKNEIFPSFKTIKGNDKSAELKVCGN